MTRKGSERKGSFEALPAFTWRKKKKAEEGRPM
jgi:hypothetical protein